MNQSNGEENPIGLAYNQSYFWNLSFNSQEECVEPAKWSEHDRKQFGMTAGLCYIHNT